MNDNCLVYRHIRLDKNQPFYIGISTNNKRPYFKHGRNSLWSKIVKKTDYSVEILFDNLSWLEACEKEKEFIQLYGRINNSTGILANLTDGGEGTLGNKHTEETKKKLSISSTKILTGRKLSEQTKKKISEKSKGNQKRLGAVLSQETKDKIAKGNIGRISPNLGKKMSIESRKKLSETHKNKGLSKGEKNPRAKLNSDKVKQIRDSILNHDKKYIEMANQYGVSYYTIQSIMQNKIWKEI